MTFQGHNVIDHVTTRLTDVIYPYSMSAVTLLNLSNLKTLVGYKNWEQYVLYKLRYNAFVFI